MEITIREAAPLLGRSTRAIRARIARGELAARRDGKAWRIALDQLPLTREQRESIQRRADDVRRAVERVLPSAATRTRDRRHRSALDLEPFAELRELLRACGASDAGPNLAAIVDSLRESLLHLAVAAHEFELVIRTDELRAARRELARACATLLLTEVDERALETAERIEARILPRIGGLLRWAERRAAGRSA